MTALYWLGVIGGVALFVFTFLDIVGTLVIPRSFNSRLSRQVARATRTVMRLPLRTIKRYETLDAVEAWAGPSVLLSRLLVWVGLLLTAFSLMLLPAVHGSFGRAYTQAGSSMFTLGYAAPISAGTTIVDYAAAYAGLLVIALQIAYLPTLYSAFNQRETEVTLLTSRAGMPAWGPELLLRTQFGIPGDGTVSVLLDDLFTRWERWSAEVSESHTTYPTLISLRSPQPYKHWLISQLAILDAAAMHLSLAPGIEPRLSARLCLRGGFDMLRNVATALQIPFDADPDPDSDLRLTYAEFETAVSSLVDSGYPCEVSAEQAWPHFRGWRVNYESIAYELAWMLNAPAAKWSGPRRWTTQEIAPFRPSNRVAAQAAARRGDS